MPRRCAVSCTLSRIQPVSPPMSSPASPTKEITSLRDLSSHQWKSGIAAWLGWLFDGLDMHLYTLVATVFVAQLMDLPESDQSVGMHGSIIAAAFLVGWAVGCPVGCPLGSLLGCIEGWIVGCLLGLLLGCAVGCPEGCSEGCPLGSLLGWPEGCPVGSPLG